MRAVAIASDRSLQVVDIDRPVPGAGEVLLDVSFCGICGSDLHMLQTYAESVAVPVGMLRRLPPAISDADGALIEPLAVAIRAISQSGATPQEPVCVLGAGPIGLLTVAGLRARGFGHVAVVEPVAGRRAAAERLGAQTSTPEEAVACVPSLLGDEPP